MSTENLRDGWTVRSLESIAEEVIRRVSDPRTSGLDRFVSSSCIDRHDVRVTRWEATSEVVSAAKRFEPGDYLLVRRSLYATDFRERAPQADFAGVCSADILTIRERDGEVAPGFLQYLLYDRGLWDFIVANSTGSITRRIKWKQIAKYEFALPPIDEQQRIVEVLSSVNDVLLRSATVARRAEEVVSSIVEQFDSSVETVKLSSVLSLLTKGTTPTSIGGGFSRSGVRFLKAENVMSGQIECNVDSFIDPATDAMLSRSRLQASDVLLTIAGTIGRSAVVDDADLPANCNQAVAILRPSAGVDPWLLSAWLAGGGARRQIEQRMVSNTISNLSLGVIGDLNFPVLTKEAQTTAVAGILAARSVAQVAKAHRESVMQMFGVVRSELLSGGSADVQ